MNTTGQPNIFTPKLFDVFNCDFRIIGQIVANTATEALRLAKHQWLWSGPLSVQKRRERVQ